MEKVFDNVLSSAGRPVAGASIAVTLFPSGERATIYSDDGITTTRNPIIADDLGYFEFYAAAGKYTLTITGDGIEPIVRTDLPVGESGDDGAATLAILANSSGAAKVGFIQSGAAPGAAGTVEDKARQVISVLDFMTPEQRVSVLSGAGTLDVTTAVQTAVDLSQTMPGGAAIYAPGGRYRLSSTINLNLSRHLTMYGDGRATQFFGDTGFGFLFSITTSSNNAYGSTFRNFMLSPALAGRTDGFNCVNANAFDFDGVTLQGQRLGMQFATSYAVRINCTFDVTQSEAIRFTTSAHGANMRGSKFYSCGNTNSLPAVNFQAATNNIVLDDVISEFNYKLASFQSCTSIRINGAYIEYNAANDIDFLGSCVGVSMDDNWLYAGFATFTITNVNGMSFKRNTVGNKAVVLGTGTANVDIDKNATVTGGSVDINYWAEQVASTGGIPFLMPDGPDPDIQARISSKGAADVALYTGSQSVLAGVFLHVASAVNYVRFEPAVAGSPASVRGFGETNAGLRLIARGTGLINSASPHRFDGNVGFYGATPIAKPTITGSRGGNAAVASIAAALAAYGLAIDNTTA